MKIENTIQFLKKECGVTFPIPLHEALKLRNVGIKKAREMIKQGLIVMDEHDMKWNEWRKARGLKSFMDLKSLNLGQFVQYHRQHGGLMK